MPRRSFPFIFIVVVALGGCADDQTPIEPNGPSTSQSPQEADQELPVTHPLDAVTAPTHGHTLRDEFAAMARRIPGGFGGVFFDDAGVLNIVLRDPGQQNAARAALELEPLIQARRSGVHGDGFDPASARIHTGMYAYDELYQWYRQVLSGLRITPPMSSISVHQNRIVIGIGNEGQREEVEQAVQDAGVPAQAVAIEIVPQVYRLSHNLRSEFRPVPGGVQTQYKTGGGNPLCTVGPNVTRTVEDSIQEGFLVNSHCTKVFGEVNLTDPTHYWQHEVDTWYEPKTTRHIGNEAIDPAVFPCVENPTYGCRNADVALALYNGETDPHFGRIARPASRNTEDLNVDSNNPRFSIARVFPWSIDGEILEKVGRTTGWSGGQVVNGCVTVAPANRPSIRCSMIVEALAGEGDSGSPVFQVMSGTNVELRGMLWGGYGSCSLGADDVLKCDHFVANNLGGIEMDLDPDGNAPLQYYTPDGGGGGDPDPPPGDCSDCPIMTGLSSMGDW